MIAGIRTMTPEDLKFETGQRVSDNIKMTGHVTGGDDEVMLDC